MGLLAKIFFDSNVDSETLFNRVSLTPEQEDRLRDKKDRIQEHLGKHLHETADKVITFFIQGSYKNKTLIKPVRKDEEYDVDIGVYVHWLDGEESFSPNELRDWTYDGLDDYSSIDSEANVENNQKERCERIRFEK